MPSDLQQNQMPATDQVRSVTGHGGNCQYIIFDTHCIIHTIDGWLSFCLQTCMSDLATRFAVKFRKHPWVPIVLHNCLTPTLLCMNSASSRTWLHCTWMFLLFSCAQSFYWIACAFLLTARYIDYRASICSPHIHHLLCVDQYFHLARITGVPQDSVGHAC